MKTLFKYALLSILLVLLVFGCSDKQTPVSPTQDSAPKLSKPSGSGAKIIRYQGEGWFYFTDFDAGVELILGIDPIGFCNNNYSFDVFDVKEVYLPNADPDLRRIVNQIKGDNI